MRRIQLNSMVVAVLLVTACGAAIGAGPDLGRLQGLGRTEMFTLTPADADPTSSATTYSVFVRLPEDYDSEQNYPTVYLLDGGHTFPMLASYYRYLRFGEEVPDLIVVGISYGADTVAEGNVRSHDFTAPSEEREHWGGAADFSKFLRDVLIPKVEASYASDPARRIVFGQSLGGQFVLYAAQAETGLFWGHIASNPALHRNLDFFLKRPPRAGATVRLFVSTASGDDPRFLVPAGEWVSHWTAQAGGPWALETAVLPDHSHFSAAPEAFRRGLAWILSTTEEAEHSVSAPDTDETVKEGKP